jgi:hypothetical protein
MMTLRVRFWLVVSRLILNYWQLLLKLKVSTIRYLGHDFAGMEYQKNEESVSSIKISAIKY